MTGRPSFRNGNYRNLAERFSMLDAAAYRAYEIAGKRAIASWRLSKINDPYVFQNVGFPVRTESVLDVAQILDTMQEDCFDYYMGEIGGLTEDEAIFFADVCVDYIRFYQRTFQSERVIVPLSTMIAHYLIYRKLLGYNPQFRNLLELGPGCGYLSFFLRYHPFLRDYSQIESTESFYLLQSSINDHVFGPHFSEYAISQRTQADQNFYVSKLKWHLKFQYEQQKVISVARNAICNHYPWWRLGDIAGKRYDIVTSNANLNEFSDEALFQYLSLISDVLADDGAIIAQCLGGGPPSFESIFEKMKSAGFVPVVLVHGDADRGRTFIKWNAVFVGRKHPLHAEYAEKTPRLNTWDRNIAFVNRMYFMNEEHPKKKRVRSISNILDLVVERMDATSTLDYGEDIDQTNGNFVIQHLGLATAALGQRLNGRKDSLDEIAMTARQAEVKQLELNCEMQAGTRRLVQEKVELEQRVAQVQERLAQVQERVAQVTAQAQASAAEAQALRNSTCWRITAPLRYLGAAISPLSRARANNATREEGS
jgi:hypothetical protein